MATLRLRKKSFPIVTKKLNRIDDGGVPHYIPTLKYVYGEVFTYIGHKWGIYHKVHTEDRKRKNDYVMVDLSTGRFVRIDSRRINLLEDLETAWLRQELQDLISAPDYEKYVTIYENLKKGR